jgi:hypothetical protein
VIVTDVSWLKRKILSFTTEMPVRNPVEISIMIPLVFRCPDKWVPVTTPWRVLWLQMGERPTIWRVAVNIFNRQSRTAYKEWSSSLGIVQVTNNYSL